MSARLEVVHGNPDEEELAVVVSVLAAAAAAVPPASPAAPAPNWARPAMRAALPTGPGAWWRSGLPRP